MSAHWLQEQSLAWGRWSARISLVRLRSWDSVRAWVSAAAANKNKASPVLLAVVMVWISVRGHVGFTQQSGNISPILVACC